MNNEPDHDQTQSHPIAALIWLVVGLAPIPILLVTVTSNEIYPSGFGPIVLVVCALCNLVGGLGCLGAIKNTAVRIILGIFLAIIFFLLSWIIAIFQACSHHVGM